MPSTAVEVSLKLLSICVCITGSPSYGHLEQNIELILLFTEVDYELLFQHYIFYSNNNDSDVSLNSAGSINRIFS